MIYLLAGYLILSFSALYIANVVRTKYVTTLAEVFLIGHLGSTALVMTLAVTLWTNILIAYRIYSTANLIPHRKRKGFYIILEIIIQSSFIYLLALVPSVALGEIPGRQSNIYSIKVASIFLNTILFSITVS